MIKNEILEIYGKDIRIKCRFVERFSIFCLPWRGFWGKNFSYFEIFFKKNSASDFWVSLILSRLGAQSDTSELAIISVSLKFKKLY